MAEDKKKVIVYADWIHIFEKLKPAEAGRLIQHFFRYINDKDPQAPDRLTELTFEPIKQTLKRDLVAYNQKKAKNSENAKKRWNDANNANASEPIKMNAIHADSGIGNGTVSVTVNETVTDKVKKNSVSEVLPPAHDEKKVKFFLLAYLMKNWREYYPAEVKRIDIELQAFAIRHSIKLPDKRFDQEDERLIKKYLDKPMRDEIRACWDYYKARNFEIDGVPIIHWDSVMSGWMRRRNNFKKTG